MALTHPVPRAWPLARGLIGGIGEAAFIDRQAAAADAFGEAGFQAFELDDPLIDPLRPFAGKPFPIAARRRALLRQFGEFGGNLLQTQADPLSEDNEGDPAQGRTRIAAVAGACSLRHDKAFFLVEPQG